MKPLDITGQLFGRLTAIRFIESKLIGSKLHRIWECRCACGALVAIKISYLTSGDTQSCGCLSAEISKRGRRRRHSGSGTPEFNVWVGMKQRCGNPSNPAYKDYGGRGISVCRDWLEFENFLRDMGPRPSPNHSIERINNDKGYSADNCKWEVRVAQANNRRSSRQITFQGQTKTLAQWSAALGIPRSTIWNRLKAGATEEVALCQ